MKAKPGKVTVSSKAKTVAAKTKPASKAAAKPAAKAKPAVKVKPAAKAKPAAKPVAKGAVKTAKPGASKPVAKPVKTAAKAAQPAVKAKTAAPAKPVTKAAFKAAKPGASKPAAKSGVKTPVKTVTKTIQSAVKAQAAAKPVIKTKPETKAPLKTAAKSPVAPKAVPAAVATIARVPAAPVVPASTSSVARAGRPSSRLAQLTVPSMAQAVASTAAKSSYAQTMPPTLIAPPLPSAIKKDPKLANNWKSKPASQLTDAELLAMPDSEYMNDAQLAAFRHRLMQLKQDILSNAGETTEHLREDTVVVPDPADRATIEEEHALELRTRDRERKLLKKIEQSITRIDANDYGYCDETGEAIGVGRLLARPTATLSLEAQQRRELKQKMFGD